MIIDCISDLHGFYPKLEGGDLLIVAGDLTARDTFEQNTYFKKWLYEQKYRKKIVIAGNHDNSLFNIKPDPYFFSSYNADTGEQVSYAEYLCDSGTEFEGLKIWGSPWTKIFAGMNPKCMAFTCDTESQLNEKWNLIPSGVDILITHSPAYGILDKNIKGVCVGSTTLQMQLFTRIFPRLLVCGHIHEAYGVESPGGMFEKAVNCSIVNERYEHVNKPIRVIL